jgi:hypothetical protein
MLSSVSCITLFRMLYYVYKYNAHATLDNENKLKGPEEDIL